MLDELIPEAEQEAKLSLLMRQRRIKIYFINFLVKQLTYSDIYRPENSFMIVFCHEFLIYIVCR